MEKMRGEEPPPRRSWRPGGRFLLIVMIILVVINLFTMRPEPHSLQLSYTRFLELVREENVATLDVEGMQASGTFKEPVATEEGQEVTGGMPFTSPPEEVERFSLTLPSLRDERLLPLLEEHGVKVTIIPQKPALLLGLLMTFGPTLLLIGLIVYFLRRQMGDRQGMFNFGRSRAKDHTLEKPKVRFDDVAGANEAKVELVEVVDFLKSPDRYKEIGAKIPRGVLLVGPPGTGKTLLARAVAGEAGVPFFSTSASEFVEMFVGVGASRVRDMFDQARRNSPAIVFIDELDAIGRQRGAGLGGGHDEREQTLNQILVEMDGFEESVNVIIIAATNRADVLDPALMRPGRFDRQVVVDLPDVRGREDILKIHMKGKPFADDVDVASLARRTPGFAGANLANLVNEAALHAARDGKRQIAMRHFNEALDKIMLGTERPLLMTEDDRRVIAYHEAGHALVAILTPESDPVNKITIIPRGRSLGVTEYLPEGDRFNYSRKYILTQLLALLGGRAAEQVAIGEITTGAENDLQRATSIARRMVGRWGMSKEVGLFFANEGDSSPFVGREMGTPGMREYSEATAAMLDETVRNILAERMQVAVRLLTKNREILDRLARALLKYETLDKKCIQAAIDGREVPPPDTHKPVSPSRSEERNDGEPVVGKPEPEGAGAA
jgi:cell division protease FtsH